MSVIERVVTVDPEVGTVVCLRERRQPSSRWREASASRIGVFEWNRNFGSPMWWRVPRAALAGARERFHVRSELRRRVLAEYRALCEPRSKLAIVESTRGKS